MMGILISILPTKKNKFIHGLIIKPFGGFFNSLTNGRF
jgi:hypothetical protein